MVLKGQKMADVRNEKARVIQILQDVIMEYAGMPISKRQLHYRLVSRGLVPNTQRDYERISGEYTVGMIKDGTISVDTFVDNSRPYFGYDLSPGSFVSPVDAYRNEIEQTIGDHDRDLDEIIRDISKESIELAKWRLERVSGIYRYGTRYSFTPLSENYGQKTRVVLGVEKQAQQGYFEPLARQYNVDLMVFRGYASISLINELKKHISNDTREIVILYFGDFDPSGIDIDRSFLDNAQNVLNLDVNLERIALTHEQVTEMDLIPAPAKDTDKRSKKFVEEYGSNVYELDAVEPMELQQMIRDAIESHIDYDAKNRRKELIRMGTKWIDLMMEKEGINEIIKGFENFLDEFSHTGTQEEDGQ